MEEKLFAHSKDLNNLYNLYECKNISEKIQALKVPNNIYLAFGMIVANFQIIDWNLKVLIRLFNHGGRYNWVFLAKIRFSQLIELFDIISKLEGSVNGRAKIKKLLIEASRLRNAIAHSMYTGSGAGFGADDMVFSHSHSKRQNKMKRGHWTYKELVNIAKQFRMLGTIIDRVVVKYRAENMEK